MKLNKSYVLRTAYLQGPLSIILSRSIFHFYYMHAPNELCILLFVVEAAMNKCLTKIMPLVRKGRLGHTFTGSLSGSPRTFAQGGRRCALYEEDAESDFRG